MFQRKIYEIIWRDRVHRESMTLLIPAWSKAGALRKFYEITKWVTVEPSIVSFREFAD